MFIYERGPQQTGQDYSRQPVKRLRAAVCSERRATSVQARGFRLLTYIELQCITLLRMDLGKDLVAASSTPLVLSILAEGESYGYAIIRRVAELSGGHLQWTDGMLYPVLHRLERVGHVKAQWKVAESGRRRRYYRITSGGRQQLVEERRQWQAVDATLRGIWSAALPQGARA